jgi:hypothetical protein
MMGRQAGDQSQLFYLINLEHSGAPSPAPRAWEIEPVGDSCRLTVTHDQLREDANAQL